MADRYVDCGMLYDGTGHGTIADARVVLDDGRVSAVGPIEDVPEPDGAERIDHSGEFVLPGLIDAHLHLAGMRTLSPFSRLTERDREPLRTARATVDCRELIEAGFTTVRDVSSKIGLGLRDAIEEGEIPGPRVYTSGLAFSQTGGHSDTHYIPHRWVEDQDPSPIVDGETACRRGARKRIRKGVDLLKIMATGGVLSEKDDPHHSHFTDAEIRAFVEEAHRVEIPVAAHAQGAAGVKDAIRNGVDTIEHGVYLDDEAIQLFLERDAVLVPTLSVMDRIYTHGEDHGIPPWGMRKTREAREAHVESIREAHEAGVTIAAGTDFIGPELVPHGENAVELELYVEMIGMEPIEALHAATGAAAETVPDDDVGTLTPGDHADVLAVSTDPRDDVTALRGEIDAVYKGGERVR
jgi:imidazolonepropionase-like amidohydrolase